MFAVCGVDGCRDLLKLCVGFNEFIVVNLMCNIGLVSVSCAVRRY